MGKHKQNHIGVTLVEVMLVLAVGSSILLFGVKHYKTLKLDADVRQLQYNVDKLFQAGADYYQANCRRQVNPTTGAVIGTTGTLDPDYTTAPTNPYPVTVASLITDGYLTGTLPLNPLVNNDGTNGGYFVQFNRVTPDADRTTTLSTGETVNIGRIIVWRVQVSVELKNATTASVYKNLLGADCLSTTDGNNGVKPCSEGASGNYVVWERLPSFAVPSSHSNYWMTNAMVKQFNQLYQTLPVLYLSSVSSTYYPQQNYLCGN